MEDDESEEESDDQEEDEEEEEEGGKIVGSGANSGGVVGKKESKKEGKKEGKKELPKLKSIDIKKMSADLLKEHLKERELSIQGQKKDLMKRLIDFETARE